MFYGVLLCVVTVITLPATAVTPQFLIHRFTTRKACTVCGVSQRCAGLFKGRVRGSSSFYGLKSPHLLLLTCVYRNSRWVAVNTNGEAADNSDTRHQCSC